MSKAKIPSAPANLTGIWTSIHLLAKNAVDYEGKIMFKKYMDMLYNEFPCEKCKGHLRDYMNNNPFTPFENMTNLFGKQIGMFKWSWMFHNAVNTRLSKPYLDWETACEMYNIDEDLIVPCTNCGVDVLPYNQDKSKIVQGYFQQKNNYPGERGEEIRTVKKQPFFF